MGQVIVSTSKLKGLADIIRLKSGKSDLMTLDSMPKRIRHLPGRMSNTIKVSDLCQSDDGQYVPNVELRAIPLLKTTGMTDMSSMLKGLGSSTYPTITTQAANYLIDVSSLDTSSATNMSSMFENTIGDVEGIHQWDTSNVTNMSSMFRNFFVYSSHPSGPARTIDLDNLDVSNVTDFSYMFRDIKFDAQRTPLQKYYIDLNNFDTSSATTMYMMFYNFQVYDIPESNYYGMYLWVPSTFISTQITNATLKPFYYGLYKVTTSSKLHVYTDATGAVTQGWGTIHSDFDMHYNSTHADFLDLVNS